MDRSTLVSDSQASYKGPRDNSQQRTHVTWHCRQTSHESKVEAMGRSHLEEFTSSLNLPDSSKRILNNSWRPSTRVKYNACLSNWHDYCLQACITPSHPTIEHVITYFTQHFDAGKSYRTIRGYISAINSIASVDGYPDICQHPLMHRFTRGLYNTRPPLPCCSKIWDVTLVFTYIQQLGDNESMPMLDLSMKVATLMMLRTGRRRNSIDSFDFNNMHLSSDTCIFYPTCLLKHHRPGQPLKAITYRAYHQDKQLCPVQAIADYHVRHSESTL